MCTQIMPAHFTGNYYTVQNDETWKYQVDQMCGADGHCNISPVGMRNKCFQKPPWGAKQHNKRNEWGSGFVADIIDFGWPITCLRI